MRQRERELQESIRRLISLSTDHFYPVVIDVNPVPLRNRTGAVCGIKKSHADAGVADIYVQGPCCRGFWMEVKAGTGKQSERQKEFQRTIEAHGGKYYIVRSVEEALKACEDFCGHIGLVDRQLEKVMDTWQHAVNE